mmetsp:Transcript_20356/g.38078  ORF Transcript_20356/g.38078 Transcript_20356/m.38078 type:complete len:115 (+) Transcript_20356:131-475(+)
MENRAKEGYISEKLVNGFLAGCLPIYFGTDQVLDVFHEDALIIYNRTRPQATIEILQYLESHPEEYQRRMSVPIFKNGRQTIEDYFSLYPTIGNGTLNQKIRNMMGLPRYIPSS